MESLFTFLAPLVVLPILGGTALGLIAAVWETATGETTPKWQQYLWFLGAVTQSTVPPPATRIDKVRPARR